MAAAALSSAMRMGLDTALIMDVSAALGVSPQRITVRSVDMGPPGAVRVTVEVLPAPTGSSEPSNAHLDIILTEESGKLESYLNNGTATSCRSRSFPPFSSRVGICGNGMCEVGEEVSSCPADCQEAAPPGTDPTHQPPSVGPAPSSAPAPTVAPAPTGQPATNATATPAPSVGGKIDTGAGVRPRAMGPPTSPDDGMAATAATVGWVSTGIAAVQGAAGVAAATGISSGASAAALGAGSSVVGGMSGFDFGLLDVLDQAQFIVMMGQLNVTQPPVLKAMTNAFVPFTGAIPMPAVIKAVDDTRAPPGLADYHPIEHDPTPYGSGYGSGIGGGSGSGGGAGGNTSVGDRGNGGNGNGEPGDGAG